MSGAVRQRTVRLSAWPASWSVNSSDILQPVISVQRNIMFLDYSLPVRNTDMFVVLTSWTVDGLLTTIRPLFSVRYVTYKILLYRFLFFGNIFPDDEQTQWV